MTRELRFSVGDRITAETWTAHSEYTVVDIVEGTRGIKARWIFGFQECAVSDSYVLRRELDGVAFTTMFADENHWSIVGMGHVAAAVYVGDVVKVSRGHGHGWDGPYEIAESVFSRRLVSYHWAGASAHPRELEDCWVARNDDGEYVIIEFSQQGKLSIVSKEKHCGFCPRCGEKLIEKTSRGFLDGPTFTVKKCVSCGNCT